MEEVLATAMLQQDGHTDPMEYKSRKIIYDTVTEDFMPLCEYEALLKERIREELRKEIVEDMKTQSLVVSPINDANTKQSLTLKRPIVRMYIRLATRIRNDCRSVSPPHLVIGTPPL
jgi:hypothetical protein